MGDDGSDDTLAGVVRCCPSLEGALAGLRRGTSALKTRVADAVDLRVLESVHTTPAVADDLPVATVADDLPVAIPQSSCSAAPARREAFDHVVFSSFLSAGFLVGALFNFNAINEHLLLGGVIAAPFCVWRPLREAWRRVPKGEPATLPELTAVAPRWNWRIAHRLGQKSRRLAHAMLGAGSLALATGLGYGLAWLSDRLGSDIPGAAIAFGALLGNAVVLFRVWRWERKNRAELIWLEDDAGDVVPCVRAAS